MARKRPLPLPLHQRLLRDYFRNSATLVVARSTTLVGFVVAALAAADWSSLLSLDFSNKKQVLAIGLVAMAHGLVTELARRRPGSKDPV